MPESKTIEIDEIVTPERTSGGDPAATHPSASNDRNHHIPGDKPHDPFKNLESSLPWKARWTLKLSRWFMLIRSKSWGKLIILPAVILAVIFIIPLGLIITVALIIRSFLRSFSRP